MSVIKFCALGGLGENGKNMYVVTVDDKIFILDAGLKYPSVDLYGVDAVIPDIRYLEENKDKIQGLFLSHGHEEHCGAICDVARKLQCQIYGSNFCIRMVEVYFQEKNLYKNDHQLNVITDDDILQFGDVTVSFFAISHSVPESLGISINTVDGSIVYAPDFSLSATKDYHYQTSFNKISSLSKKNVLMLCPESLGVNNLDRVHSDYSFNREINEILSNSNRVIFSMFSYDLNRIQKVVDLCVSNNRKVAILGRKVQKTINVAMNNNYLNIPEDSLVNLKFIDDENDNNSNDLAVIIAGMRHEPYFMIQRMITNQDKLIKIQETDNVVIISPPAIGTEKLATRAVDQLSRIGCKVYDIPRSKLASSHADGEDLKMLYQMTKPLYICPVEGEYRHQFVHKNIAKEVGFKDENILVLENGEEISFVDGILQEEHNKIDVGDVLVDGSIVGDINEVVLKDRENLAESGAIVIICNIDSVRHQLLSGPVFCSRGFLSQSHIGSLDEKIVLIAERIIKKELLKKIIDWNGLKNDIKDSITEVVRDDTKKNPVIIPVIIDVNGEDL